MISLIRQWVIIATLLLLSGCSALGFKNGGRMEMMVPERAAEQKQGECVVLLHGLARSSSSMHKLQKAFFEQGYRTLNIDYPSTEYTIDEQIEYVIRPQIEAHCSPSEYRLHFIGHSLGGILARAYIARHRPQQLGSVVMIAPPNQGSALVDKLKWIPVFHWINGPAGEELGTEPGNFMEGLPVPDYPLLVIAGTRSLNPFYSLLIPGDDDGKVSVEGAKVEGMEEFFMVPFTHTFIMDKPVVIDKSIHFVGTH